MLDSHHFLQTENAVGAAQPASLYSSMWSFTDAEAGDGVVHHDCASLDAAGQRFSACAIACPNAGGETEIRIIGQPDRFIISVERHYGKERTERLLAHDLHGMSDFGQYGGSVKIRAELRESRASDEHSRSVQARIFNLCFYVTHLQFADQRANISVWIKPVTHAQ